jgi:hypothetical protein
MPVLVGVAAGIAVVAVVWLITGGARVVIRTCVRIRLRLRSAVRRSFSKVQPDAEEREWIYGDRAFREARPSSGVNPIPDEQLQATSGQRQVDVEVRSPLKGPEEAANPPLVAVEEARERLLGEAKHQAELEASAIVRAAEEKASAIIAAAEVKRARLEEDAAHERALAAEERAKLSVFLNDVLAEVQHLGVRGTNIHTLSELRKLKRSVGSGGE